MDKGDLLSSSNSYRRLVEKLNYLTLTRPDMANIASMVSHDLTRPDIAPRLTPMEAALRIMRSFKVHSALSMVMTDQTRNICYVGVYVSSSLDSHGGGFEDYEVPLRCIRL